MSEQKRKLKVTVIASQPIEGQSPTFGVQVHGCMDSGGCAGCSSGNSIGSKCKALVVHQAQVGDTEIEFEILTPLEEGEVEPTA